MGENKRVAVVTGANKGIGFEIVRRLVEEGVTVILTARDEKRGKDAASSLSNPNNNVFFHQLDVRDPNSVRSSTKISVEIEILGYALIRQKWQTSFEFLKQL
ncbi:(+)-neomenthol dehydrogenase [Ranunculus cassubicifolius]